jgi:hypothetical protein
MKATSSLTACADAALAASRMQRDKISFFMSFDYD